MKLSRFLVPSSLIEDLARIALLQANHLIGLRPDIRVAPDSGSAGYLANNLAGYRISGNFFLEDSMRLIISIAGYPVSGQITGYLAG